MNKRFYLSIFLNLKHGPTIIPTLRRMHKHPEKYTLEQRYKYVQYVCGLIAKSAFTSTEVYGEENLPKEGGYVMFPNHEGKYDMLGIVAAHKTPCTFIMDKAKSYQFIVREIVDCIDAKRLDLNDIRQNLRIINKVSEEVKQGFRYVIFSEGGYKDNGNNVRAFKPGSFKCATLAKAPIVPVTLIDSHLPYGSNIKGHIKTKVIFMKPLYYDDYKDMKTPEICDYVRNQIIECMRTYGIEQDPDFDPYE